HPNRIRSGWLRSLRKCTTFEHGGRNCAGSRNSNTPCIQKLTLRSPDRTGQIFWNATRQNVVALPWKRDVLCLIYVFCGSCCEFPVPWCANKLLMRAAGRGCLPEEILRRPKSPLPYDPIEIQIRLGKWSPFPLPQLSQRLLDLIDKQKWIAELGKYKSASKWLVHCPLSLNLWLKSVEMPEAMQ